MSCTIICLFFSGGFILKIAGCFSTDQTQNMNRLKAYEPLPWTLSKTNNCTLDNSALGDKKWDVLLKFNSELSFALPQ